MDSLLWKVIQVRSEFFTFVWVADFICSEAVVHENSRHTDNTQFIFLPFKVIIISFLYVFIHWFADILPHHTTMIAFFYKQKVVPHPTKQSSSIFKHLVVYM